MGFCSSSSLVSRVCLVYFLCAQVCVPLASAIKQIDVFTKKELFKLSSASNAEATEDVSV